MTTWPLLLVWVTALVVMAIYAGRKNWPRARLWAAISVVVSIVIVIQLKG